MATGPGAILGNLVMKLNLNSGMTHFVIDEEGRCREVMDIVYEGELEQQLLEHI